MVPPKIKVSVRDKGYARGGPVVPCALSSKDLPGSITPAWIAQYGHLLLLVHGFNDSEADADTAYDAMLANLDATGLFDVLDKPQLILCFHWPGNVAVIDSVEFFDVLGYPKDIAQACASAVQLQSFFDEVRRCGGQTLELSIICHSMGGRVVLEALHLLGKSPFAHLVALLAPAVPVDLVDASKGAAGYLAATANEPHVVRKYHSWIDWVLTVAFPAGQSLAFVDGIEKADYLEAVGSYGDPAGFGIEPPYTGLHFHSDYWGNLDIAADIAVSIAPTCRGAPAPRPLPAPYDLPAYSLPQPS